MSKTLSNIRVYGDGACAVHVAPKGTTLPTTLAAPSAPFTELGWGSEDGLPIGRSSESSTFRAWQGGTLVRRRVRSNEDTFKFWALEETLTVVKLYYPGATATTATGVTTIHVPQAAQTDERAWILDFEDSPANRKRYVIPVAEVNDRATIAHKSDAMTIYEFTATIIGDFDIITNSPALAAS